MLKKYIKILNRIKDLFGKEFNSESVCNGNSIKTKINSQTTNFYGINVSVKSKHYTQFSILLLESIITVNDKHFPQIFLETANM